MSPPIRDAAAEYCVATRSSVEVCAAVMPLRHGRRCPVVATVIRLGLSRKSAGSMSDGVVGPSERLWLNTTLLNTSRGTAGVGA